MMMIWFKIAAMWAQVALEGWEVYLLSSSSNAISVAIRAEKFWRKIFSRVLHFVMC